jgi:hypothetical protein
VCTQGQKVDGVAFDVSIDLANGLRRIGVK